MPSDAAGVGPTNPDGRRLLELVRAEVAELSLTDTELVAALDRHVARAVAEVFPADRPVATGPLVLTDDESARVALAVVTGAVAETEPRAAAPVRRARDLRATEVLRLALSPRRRRSGA